MMTTDEHTLLANIHSEPTDVTARVVYADWLDDHDRREEGAATRMVAEWWDGTRRLEYAAVLEAGAAQVTCPTCRGAGGWDGLGSGPCTKCGGKRLSPASYRAGSGTIPDPATVARAGLIRLAVEMERNKDAVAFNTATHRERLIRDHADAWRKAGKCERCGGKGAVIYPVYGSHDNVPTSEMGALCPDCRGTRDAGGLMRTRDDRTENDPERWIHPVDWSTGFPVVSCTLAECIADGEPTPWLRAVTKWHAGATFNVTDREAMGRGNKDIWYWRTGRPFSCQHFLSPPVFRYLRNGAAVTDSVTEREYMDYPTREAAHAALGRAVADFGRYYRRKEGE